MKYFQKIVFIYCLLATGYALAHHGKGYKIIDEQQMITAGVHGGVKPSSMPTARSNR